MLLMCLRIGLTLSDFCRLKVGTIIDILIEHNNQIDEINTKNKGDIVREANSTDNIMTFF